MVFDGILTLFIPQFFVALLDFISPKTQYYFGCSYAQGLARLSPIYGRLPQHILSYEHELLERYLSFSSSFSC